MEKVKLFTSGGADLITPQEKFQPERAARVTCSLFFITNQPPTMSLWEPAAFGRVTAIPLTHHGRRDKSLLDTVQTSAVAQAVLARLIRAAEDNSPTADLAKPKAILEYEADLRERGMTVVQSFAARYVERPDRAESLWLREELWVKFCALHERDPQERGVMPAGVSFRTFSQDIREALEMPRRAAPITKRGEQHRGWHGIRFT